MQSQYIVTYKYGGGSSTWTTYANGDQEAISKWQSAVNISNKYQLVKVEKK